MNYRRIDYLRDTFWFIDFPMTLAEEAKPRLKKFTDAAIDFEYDKYIFRIAENLPYAALILFLGLFATLTLAKYTERQNGVRVSTITTNSMYPAIAPGSLIISTPDGKYHEGDVITYKEVNPKTGLETGRAITHRIISENNNKKAYITKGDFNDQPDPGIIENNYILGKVIFVIPYLGYFDVIVKTFPGFFIFIVIPAILLVRNELNYLKEERKFSQKSKLIGL